MHGLRIEEQNENPYTHAHYLGQSKSFNETSLVFRLL